MPNFIVHLTEIVAGFWTSDAAIRRQATLSESGLERKSRRSVAGLCAGALLVLLLLGAVLWWW